MLKFKKMNIMKSISLSIFILLISFPALAQWNLSTFIPGNLTEVEFPAADAAYATGYQYIYKSTDGGITWNEVYDGGPFANFTDLGFINGDTGFVNFYGTILRTFDGGGLWTAIDGNHSQPVKITDEMLFASYASNDTTYIIRSDNYGTGWIVIYQHYEIGALPYLFSF